MTTKSNTTRPDLDIRPALIALLKTRDTVTTNEVLEAIPAKDLAHFEPAYRYYAVHGRLRYLVKRDILKAPSSGQWAAGKLSANLHGAPAPLAKKQGTPKPTPRKAAAKKATAKPAKPKKISDHKAAAERLRAMKQAKDKAHAIKKA